MYIPQNNNHLTRPSFSLLPPFFNKRVKKHQRKPHFFVSNNYVLMKEWAVAAVGVILLTNIYYPKQFRTSLTCSHAWRRITKYSSKQTFWLPFPSLHPHIYTCAHITVGTEYRVSDMDGVYFKELLCLRFWYQASPSPVIFMVGGKWLALKMKTL